MHNRSTTPDPNNHSKHELTKETKHDDSIEFDIEDNINQHQLSNQKDNYPFGDIMNEIKQPNSIRVFYKNANGIRSYNSWDTWDNACNSIHKLSVDIIGISETNINWNEKNRSEARNILQKYKIHQLLLVPHRVLRLQKQLINQAVLQHY
jgi:hypothetical protein